MEISLPNEARVIILEGIAGSGKTTLKGYLKKQLRPRMIYEFSEQELLLGWKHIHVPHVSSLRIQFINIFLDQLEKNLKSKPDAIFILERFHLSMKVLEWEFENNFEEKYQEIVDRIRKLPIFILLTELNREQIRERMHHRERSRQWSEFVEEKLKLRGFENLEMLSIEQQYAYVEAAATQGIPYRMINVELNNNGEFDQS